MANGKTRDEWLYELAKSRAEKSDAESRERAARALKDRAEKAINDAVAQVATFDDGLYLLPLVPNGTTSAKVRDTVRVSRVPMQGGAPGQTRPVVDFDTIHIPDSKGA